MDNLLLKWQLAVLSMLRIVTAFLFMQHGTQKMFSFPAPAHNPFDFFSLLGVAATLEVIGGYFLLIGLFTRPIAFLLSGQMAFAYFIAHSPKAFWPLLNGGELAIMFCFVFLYFSVAGGGAWSVDTLRTRK